MREYKMDSQTATHIEKSTMDILCFDKNEFMKANFSVDEFLHQNRNVPSLEQLRDNLGLYLKGLRASMIDLINEDYADFVSLSANLVGLNQSIDTIQKPLQSLREEIDSTRAIIEENEGKIRNNLERKKLLREFKRNLHSLKKVYEISARLKKLLGSQLKDGSFRADDLERAALDVMQLKFNENFSCQYLEEDQKRDIETLNAEVLENLRKFFSESLRTATSTCSENLERSLRIYITLNACDVAEKVFREDVVAPYMGSIVSEYELQNSPQGLAGIYNKIFNFISMHMTDLLRLTLYSDKVQGFNFLVNSFWADVEMRLEAHLSSIFAPGNSEIFYSKYKYSREFVVKIEELLTSESMVQAFRQHKQTKSFQSRWNLPVYFQICFQEISGQFEGLLEPLLSDDTLDLKSSGYYLQPFHGALLAIERCWDERTFLIELFPKFYKLTIQIVLRLSRWIKDLLNAVISSKKPTEMSSKASKTTLVVTLYEDIHTFDRQLPTVQEMICKAIGSQRRDHAMIRATIAKSFGDLKETLIGHIRTIIESLVHLLVSVSGAENMRQVNDIPRLYRKTNRDMPTRPSAYIEHMLRPIKQFVDDVGERLDRKTVEDVLVPIFSKITSDYYHSVCDVLTSVQRTEESLRRLRNLKSGSASTPVISKSISDDDKIRMQLQVDVLEWTNEVTKLNLNPSQIDRLADLNSIVDESVKSKSNKDAQN